MSEDKKVEEISREDVRFWHKWIPAAKKAAEVQWADAEAAYKEYERLGREDGVGDKNVRRGYPIYTTSCKTLEAAYYSQTPKVRSKRLYGIEDELALTMSLIVDRAGEYLIKNGGFDDAMVAARGDYIHAGSATTQVVYTTETEPVRVPLSKVEVPDEEITDGAKVKSEAQYAEEDGNIYEGEVFEDEGGYFYNGVKAKEETQKIMLMPCLYDERLFTPTAKTQAEITEWAYKFCLSYDEAEEKFNRNEDGTSKGRMLPYTSLKDSEDKTSEYQDNENGAVTYEKVLEGWECYCFHTKKVYWVSEKFKENFLAIEKDPYGLRGFIPSPRLALSNKHRKNLFCTPGYVYLEATINQLHLLYFRIFRLIDGIRRRALVWGGSPELIAALNDLEGEDYLTASSINEILEKGGIENLIVFVPVKELVDALSECMKIEEHFKQNFYEWFRLPDILRGVSDAQETLGAQEIKTDAATDGFRYDKKQIINLARDSAEIMLDMALGVWSDEKFAKVCGYEYLEPGDPGTPPTPPGPPTPENPEGAPGDPGSPPTRGHKERFFEALTKLRNDEERIVRIDFETDSSSFRDEAREITKHQMIADTTIKGLEAISRIAEPKQMHIAMKMLLGTLNSMGGSTQTEDLLKSVEADLKAEMEAPPEPPPPDYEAMKLQVQTQSLQIKSQEVNIKAAMAQREADRKDFETRLIAAQQTFEQNLKVAEENRASGGQLFDQQLAAAKQASDQQLKKFQAALDQALVAIEQQKVQIEAYQAKAQVEESLMEEVRLAKEAATESVAKVLDFYQTQQALTQAPEPSKPSKPPTPVETHFEIQRDAEGNAQRIVKREIH